MGEIIDRVKGKAKQVGGIITGDNALKREGQLDEAQGNVKGVINKVEHAIHKAADAVRHAVKKV